MTIIISSLEEMGHFFGKVTHLISIVDPDDASFIPPMGIGRARRLVVLADDVESLEEARTHERAILGSKCITPTKAMVQKVLRFTSSLSHEDVCLVHCAQGISRSPALAFAILCQAQPDLPESQVFQQIRRLRPQAFPNALIVAHADALLGRDGRMSRAIQVT